MYTSSKIWTDINHEKRIILQMLCSQVYIDEYCMTKISIWGYIVQPRNEACSLVNQPCEGFLFVCSSLLEQTVTGSSPRIQRIPCRYTKQAYECDGIGTQNFSNTILAVIWGCWRDAPEANPYNGTKQLTIARIRRTEQNCYSNHDAETRADCRLPVKWSLYCRQLLYFTSRTINISK